MDGVSALFKKSVTTWELVPVIIYIIAAVNSRFHSFFLFPEVNERQTNLSNQAFKHSSLTDVM